MLNSPPFVDRDQNSGIFATARDKLRSIPQAGFQEFAEAGFSILHGPGSNSFLLTSHLTSLYLEEDRRKLPVKPRYRGSGGGTCVISRALRWKVR